MQIKVKVGEFQWSAEVDEDGDNCVTLATLAFSTAEDALAAGIAFESARVGLKARVKVSKDGCVAGVVDPNEAEKATGD